MKKIRTAQLGALLIGCAICFGPAHSSAAASDNNPIVFSAVARDADGFVKNNATMLLDCRLLNRQTRSVVYSETHTLAADAMGQLQIPLGNGTPTYGDFQQVDFSQPLDLVVYDGDQLLTDAPLTQVPSAAFAQQADNAKTAETAEQAYTASYALNAQSAQQIDGIAFDDEAEPDRATIWSSAKVAQMLGNNQSPQTGQTAIAKEKAERMAEDQRIWDTINARDNGRIAMEERVNGLGDELGALEERVDKHDEDIGTLEERVDGIDADLTGLDDRIGDSLDIVWDSIHDIRNDLDIIDGRVDDSLLIVWDSIDAIKDELRRQKEEIEQQMDGINFCLVNDAQAGLYHNAIPLYDPDRPDTVGLFANPILKVLRQDGNCDLFSALNLAPQLKRSYRARVMTYNNGGNPAEPKEVYIPASDDGLDIYVDNYRIDDPVVYYTYDALVFDVEFYFLGDGTTPKLYVTLIRE